MKKFLMIIAAALLFPAMLFAKGDVVAYLPNYRNIPTQGQLEKLTHLILMAIVPGVDGKGTAVNLPDPEHDGSWSKNLDKVIADAHSNGVDVIIALGGWGGTGSFPESVKPANRTEFVKNIMEVVRNNGFDGVDIDWEYPNTAEEVTNFEGFMVELKDSLGEKRLSFAIGAQYSPSKYTAATYEAMDALQLMTYDMAGSWAWGRHHSDAAKSKEKLDEWLNSGLIEKEKVFLGVPFYGRPADGGEAEVYPVIIGSNPAQYSQVDEAPGKDGGNWCYDGVPTIKNKTGYAYDRGAGGIMIWEIGQDYDVQNAESEYSLLKAIYDETKHVAESPVRRIWVTYNESGTVTNESETVNSGNNFEIAIGAAATLTITPNSGSEIIDVKINGISSDEAKTGTYTFDNISESQFVQVVFGKRHGVPGNIDVAGYSFLSKLGDEKVEADGNLGWLENGSSVEYLLNVEEAGEYLISMETAEGNGNDIAITINDEELITVSGGSNWTDYAKKTAKITLPAGNMTLKIGVNGAVNIKNISITEDDGTAILSGNKMKYAKTFGAAIINGKINLSVPAAAKNASFMLFDVRGRMLMQQQISINSGFAGIALPKNIAKNQAAILQVKTNSGFNLTKRVLLK